METQQPPPLPRENAREFTPVRRNMWRHFTYCMRHYADFRGRATRAEFWSFSAISALFSCLFLLPLFAARLICLQKIASNPETLASCAAASFALGGLWYLAILVPTLAATWRRLHDIGLSGAFYFVSFIPLVGGLVLFVLEIIDSKPGANKYGGPTKYP
ncbi:MAG: DUF805 domain-containing protein [Akkermansiaceae bacterium]|nr:DUF805 domain-containing protein [Akkermansiaceae bacterium]